MTQEALRALEMLKLKKQCWKEYDKIKEEFPLLDKENPSNPINSSIQEFRQSYYHKYMAQGERLHQYCMDHLSIGDEFEREIKKLNAKIKAENEKFDKDTQEDYEYIKKEQTAAERKKDQREKIKKSVLALVWSVITLYIVAYIALIFVAPAESNLPNLLVSGVLIFLVAPVVGLILLKILIKVKLDESCHSAWARCQTVQGYYRELQEKKRENVSHLTGQKEDYQHIVDIINTWTKRT